MNVKCTIDEESEGNENHIRNLTKGDFCYIVTELWPKVLWKEEYGSNEIWCLTDDISKQIGEFEALFCLVAYSEMHRDKLRKEWLNT